MATAVFAQAAVKLNPLFSDGMVLQRGQEDPVFGTAAPGTFVEVRIANQRAGATADASGNWKATLRPLSGGGPYVLTVTSGSLTINVQDVLVGEVWVASGQSNMEFVESGADDYIEAQAEAKPEIRFFTVAKQTAEQPSPNLTGTWESSSSTTVGHFSAVALSFARELNRKLNVSVGIIHTSWGGTPAEAWTSKEALEKDPLLKPMMDSFADDLLHYPEKKQEYDSAMQQWINGRKGGENQGFDNGWALNQFADADWKSVPAGSLVDTTEGRQVVGSFWYRQTVNLPDDWYGKKLRLQLGALDDYDDTYFNGVRVGRTDDKTDNSWNVERAYEIAPGIVRKGANTIAIRIFNAQGEGGMRGPVEDMKVGLEDGSATVPLNGEWKFKIEQEIDPNAPRPHLPAGPGNPNAPAELFNGMIAPLIPYAIRGAIWYQGESNVGRADQYSSLFPDMIRDWRSRWLSGPFPFYFVQLANFHPRVDQPADSDWAALREAQTKTLQVENTGMAVIIDIGEANDIHPKNKREVGRRLSLWALAKTYRQPVVYGSPMFSKMDVNGNQVRVMFENGSLITSDGQPPKGFAIAGEDKHFYWADARIDGSSVVLSSANVPHPVAVRYGWADNPDVNLTNHASLPACPFRTDSWEKTTP